MGGFTDVGRGVARRVFTPVARVLLKLNVSPDAVTLVGTIGTSVAALYFFPQGELLRRNPRHLHLRLLRLPRRNHGAARRTTIDVGGLLRLDARPGRRLGHLLRSSRSGSPVTVTTRPWLPSHWRRSSGGLMVSYARARAEGLGADASTGIAERTERLVLTLAAAGLSGLLDLPWILDVGLWLVAILSWITVAQRIWAVRQQLLPR